MTLDARAIAVQGLGSSPRFVALQGLVPIVVPTSMGAGRSYKIPPDLRVALRRQVIDEDDLLLLLAVCIDGNSLH